MSWKGAPYKEDYVPLYADEWNALVAAADELWYVGHPYLGTSVTPTADRQYDIGSPSYRLRNIYAAIGDFSDDVFVQGKRVIKDGDPVNIYEFIGPAGQDVDNIYARLASIDLYARYSYQALMEIKAEVAELKVHVYNIEGYTKTPSKLFTVSDIVDIYAKSIYPLSIKTKRVVVKADKGNMYNLLLGDANAQSFPLAPGEREEIHVDDPSKVYVKAEAGTLKYYALFEVVE